MSLAQLFLLCALAMAALGALSPLLSSLHIRTRDAVVWLGVATFALWIEDKFAAVVLAAPAVPFLIGLHWRGGVWRACLAALAAAAAAVGVLIFLRQPPFEPGLLAGALGAIVATAIARYRRVALAASFGALPLTFAILPLIGRYAGALAALPTSDLLTGSVVCALFGCLLTGIAEALRDRNRRLEFA